MPGIDSFELPGMDTNAKLEHKLFKDLLEIMLLNGKAANSLKLL